MIGLQQLIIDASDWIKGMSSGPEISDGGFSTDSESGNPVNTPGVLYAPAAGIDIDTDIRLTDEIIASSPDMVSFLGTNRLLVAENGSYYSYNGTKIPAVALQTDSINTYQKGFTDIITYAGEAYVTTKEALVRWQNPSTFNNSFLAFTSTNRPHPAIVFEDNAFYGDKNLLLRQTSAGGTPTTILTLSSDQEIIALGVDPGTGKMLISTTNSLNISNTLTSINKLLWYDGFSNKPMKSVFVEDMILGFHTIGGITYVGYGQNLGYINGSGIQFLRSLLNVTLDQQDLPYKHNFASIGKTLYVVDGAKILAYGDIIGGKKGFYYCYKNQINSNKFKSIFNAGSNKLGFSFVTSKLYTVDTSSVATLDKLDVYTNWYHFQRPVILRSMYLDMKGQIASTGNFTLSYDIPGSTGNALSVRGGTQTSINEVKDIIGFLPSHKTRSIRLRLQNATENDGIRKIIVYYDYAE